MLYAMENGKPVPKDPGEVLSSGHQYFGFLNEEQSGDLMKQMGITHKPLSASPENKGMTYENHEGFDLIRLNLPGTKSLPGRTDQVSIYVFANKILFLSRDISPFLKLMQCVLEGDESVDFDRLLNTFFERLTAGDAAYLDGIEKEIAALEDALIANQKSDCVREISALRKELMILKRYYEQLLDVLDELLENENDLLPERSLRYFRIYDGKVDRFYHNVLNLRDYVTQVREAYQAEVDINLNYVMKIFTVITAIFLPLTLLVGWYGMNLKMPEFQTPYAYPAVILLSVAVVVFCLVYFKRHKWF